MKILIAHSDTKLPARESIDIWRIIRPFDELKKHVDWQIDHRPHLIPLEYYDKHNRVNTQKLVEELKILGHYDIIWTSYFPDAILFDAMTFVGEKYGTKFVLDVDDDMFHIPKTNSIWNSIGIEGVSELKYMVKQSPYLVTSSPILLKDYQQLRQKPTYLLPNYIGHDYKHKPFDNGDKVVIGFFGSVTHKHDLINTGFNEALARLMHKYKQLHCGTVGLEINNYLPKARYTHHPGKPGRAWLTEVWPNLNLDIAVAPLEDTRFNRARTNIKWLETAMIPAAFVGSDIPPYQGAVKSGQTGLLVKNDSQSWYEALEALVLDKDLRRRLASTAHAEVNRDWHIKTNWLKLKDIIEGIVKI